MKKAILVLVMSVFCMSGMAQQIVKGLVVDEHNDGIPGVRVEVVGRSEMTVTDIDGRFVLEIPGPAKHLQFSYVGYKPVQRRIRPDMYVKFGEGWAGSPTGYRGMFDFMGGFGFGPTVNAEGGRISITEVGKNPLIFGFSMTHGAQVTPHLFVGLGFGVQFMASRGTENYANYDWQTSYTAYKFGTFNFPLYLETRWDFGLAEKTAPYIGLRMGWLAQVGLDDGYDFFESYYYGPHNVEELSIYNNTVSGFLFQPSIGMRTRLKGKRSMNFGLQYNVCMRQKFTSGFYNSEYGGNSDYQQHEFDILKGGALLFNFGFDW